ncbi:MAG: TonB family protein [Gammaproteobacteria bacterium]
MNSSYSSSAGLFMSLTLALLINLLLFFAIQRLVEPDHSTFSLPELVTMVDFIRFKKEDKLPEPKLHELLPDKPKPPKKPPPPPRQKQPDPEKPKPKKIKLPTPEVKLPLHMTNGPHLGDFLKKPKPKKTIIQKTAPIPVPVVEADPEPIIEQVTEPVVQEPVEQSEIDPGPTEPQIETDVVPTYKSKPKYPSRALRARISGVVTLEFIITEKGIVKDPIIIKSDPPKIFDKSALKAIKKWKFKPKVYKGKPVSRRAQLNINFNIK